MRVIICGGRDLNEQDRGLMNAISCATKERQWKIETVISGAARGGDQIGERWAKRWDRKVERYPANWNKYGRGAGFVRNEQMAQVAEAVIALPGGSGTAHMIKTARRLGLPVHIIRPE